MNTQATIRTVTAHGVTYAALPDVAAMLLDTAETLDAEPRITAPEALRSIATGMARD